MFAFGECIRTHKLPSEVASCAFGSHEVVVCGGLDKDLHVLRSDNETALPGHKSKIQAVQCTPDGLYATSFSLENAVRVWNLFQSVPLDKLPHPSVVTCCTISTHNGLIASCCMNHGGVFVWNPDSTTPAATLSAPCKISNCEWSLSGNHLCGWGEQTGTVVVWDTQSSTQCTLFEHHKKRVTACAFGPLGIGPEGAVSEEPMQLVVTASEDVAVYLWNAVNGNLISSIPNMTKKVDKIHFRPDGVQFVTSGLDSVVRVWNTANMTLAASLTAHSQRVTNVSYSPDGHFLATSAKDGQVILWAAKKLTQLATLTHEAPVSAIAWHTDKTNSQTLATASKDTVKLWATGLGSMTKIEDNTYMDFLFSIYKPENIQVDETLFADANNFKPLVLTSYLSRVDPMLGLFTTILEQGRWNSKVDAYYVRATLAARRFIQKQLDLAGNADAVAVLTEVVSTGLTAQRDTMFPHLQVHVCESEALEATSQAITKLKSDLSRQRNAHRTKQLTDDIFELVTHALEARKRLETLVAAIAKNATADNNEDISVTCSVCMESLTKLLVTTGLRRDKNRWAADCVIDALKGKLICSDLATLNTCLGVLRSADPFFGSYGAADHLPASSRICLVSVTDYVTEPAPWGWAGCTVYLYFLDDPNQHICKLTLGLKALHVVTEMAKTTHIFDKVLDAERILVFRGAAKIVSSLEGTVQELTRSMTRAITRIRADSTSPDSPNISKTESGVFKTDPRVSKSESGVYQSESAVSKSDAGADPPDSVVDTDVDRTDSEIGKSGPGVQLAQPMVDHSKAIDELSSKIVELSSELDARLSEDVMPRFARMDEVLDGRLAEQQALMEAWTQSRLDELSAQTRTLIAAQAEEQQTRTDAQAKISAAHLEEHGAQVQHQHDQLKAQLQEQMATEQAQLFETVKESLLKTMREELAADSKRTRENLTAHMNKEMDNFRTQLMEEMRKELKKELKRTMESTKHELQYELAQQANVQIEDLKTKVTEAQSALAKRRSIFARKGSGHGS